MIFSHILCHMGEGRRDNVMQIIVGDKLKFLLFLRFHGIFYVDLFTVQGHTGSDFRSDKLL